MFEIKRLFGAVELGSETACYCHDLGRVVKDNEIIKFCSENNILVSEEERELPSILHQKISCFIAETVFNISDVTILDAIKYHTTLDGNQV